MNKKLFSALVLVFLLTAGVGAIAADNNATAKPAAKSTAQTELENLVAQIQAKMKAGKNTEADLADELKQFDVLLASHKNEKTDDVAQIAFMKALLYLQVFDNTEKAVPMIKQLKIDYPETKQGKQADDMLANIEKQAEGKKIQKALAVGSKFPDFAEKDLDGKPLSIANYKGKVVLVDFWATWCPPCVGELPNVLKTYEKYHSKGFEIVGISLDSDKNKLTDFMKKKNMTWAQYFDGKRGDNKLAGKYGVNSIPATYLLDGTGQIVAKDLRGEALEEKVASLMTKK